MAIKIKGLDQLTKDLRNFGQEGDKIVKFEIETAATNIERSAKNSLPFQFNFIDQRINKEFKNGGFTAKVGPDLGVPNPLYGWIEFGTGSGFRDLIQKDPQNYNDPEVRELAYQFFETGLGKMPATPYMMPSFFEERPKLIERLKKELDNLAKKS